MKIPFCKINWGEEEKKAVCDVIDSGWIVQGEKTKEFEEKFAEYVGAEYAVFVDSGTRALELSIEWLKKVGGIPFKVPSFTFGASAEVIAHFKILNFIDVDKDFCVKEVDKETLAVHLTGNRAKEGALIYDSAHRIEKDDVKNSDALWCYSFYATKNLACNAGMIAVNVREIAEWLRLARDHGVTKGTQERYQNGDWDYDVAFAGWRGKADDLRAVIGLEQLKKLPAMTIHRNLIKGIYNTEFDLERTGNHLYPVLVENRNKFMAFMKENGISCAVHFKPLHKMTAYKSYFKYPLPNTEYFGEHLVSLPLYPSLTNNEVLYIIQRVKESNLLIKQ